MTGRPKQTSPPEDADDSMARRLEQEQRLALLLEKINEGLLLEEVLDYVYQNFKTLIPYERIGFALLEENNRVVRARWARTTCPEPRITEGYSAELKGSSLQGILDTGVPRILNDLEAYLLDHPASDSTLRIVQEGMRSSLTCPLIARNRPVGFMFFSSTRAQAYRHAHVEFFQRIARQLSVILEKSRLYQELVELSDQKSRFLGMAAHDLRNPLFVIRSYQEMLTAGASDTLTPPQQKALALIGSNCAEMINRVNTLLDVTVIASGRLHLKIEPVDPPSFLAMVADNAGLLATNKQIRLRTECAPGLGPFQFDPHRIQQVLENLLSNAFKFSPPGTEVLLQAATDGPALRIAVIDQGPGIPEDEQHRLFRDFSTTSVKTTAGEPSTGLGLAICRRIMEAHGGQLTVESAEGKGSTFALRLPRADKEKATG